MWGWETYACDLCGAPSSYCDCLEQVKAINQDVKAIRNSLITQNRVRLEAIGVRRDYVSPDYLAALRAVDARRSLMRALSKEIPEHVIRESFLNGEISEEEYDVIFALRDEANASWITRWWRGLWEDD